jgi:hypothetical protein
MGKEEAFRAAIKNCIENGILRDFLKRHGSEVYMGEWLKG